MELALHLSNALSGLLLIPWVMFGIGLAGAALVGLFHVCRPSSAQPSVPVRKSEPAPQFGATLRSRLEAQPQPQPQPSERRQA